MMACSLTARRQGARHLHCRRLAELPTFHTQRLGHRSVPSQLSWEWSMSITHHRSTTPRSLHARVPRHAGVHAA
jgi:hypothetical protein